MLFIPSLVLGLFVFLKGFIDISYTQAMVILLQSSMPPFVMSVILSEKFKLNSDLAIAAVNLGLIVLPITVSLWVYLGEKFLK
jgi:predicted permease